MSQNLNLENIKKEKDGIDVLADIFFHAVFGELVTPADLERFKWYGVYAQDEKQEYFKLRVPLSLGELNLNQLKTLSLISKKFSDDTLIFSNEQKVEFKNLKIYDLPNIFNLLLEAKLNTHFEAGHTIRRVLTCPVNGIDDTQLVDVEPLAKEPPVPFQPQRPPNLPVRCVESKPEHSPQNPGPTRDARRSSAPP